jgi:GNAT superfamily N-acetyltransferase
MEIAYLKDKLEFIPKLAEGIITQWSSMYKKQGKELNDIEKTLIDRAVDDKIPLTMVGFDGDTVIGSVTIKADDFSSRPDLTPWIAGVFVFEEFRLKGYGRELIQFAEGVAKEKFDYDKIYLYTGSAENLYLKVGYSVVDRVQRETGSELVIMEKEI